MPLWNGCQVTWITTPGCQSNGGHHHVCTNEDAMHFGSHICKCKDVKLV